MDDDDGISHNLKINTFYYDIINEVPELMYYQNVGSQGMQESCVKNSLLHENKRQLNDMQNE
jgi:hypothetical protein